MEGNINRKRRSGRLRETNLGNMKKLLSLASYEEMKRLADKKELFAATRLLEKKEFYLFVVNSLKK